MKGLEIFTSKEWTSENHSNGILQRHPLSQVNKQDISHSPRKCYLWPKFHIYKWNSGWMEGAEAMSAKISQKKMTTKNCGEAKFLWDEGYRLH